MRTMMLAGALIWASGVAACSDDDVGSGGRPDGAAGQQADASGGVGGGAGSGASGGTGGTGGGGAGGSGGSAGSAGAAGSAPDAGEDAGDGAADAGGCLPPNSEYSIDICVTLTGPAAHSTKIVPPYLGEVNADCRVSKMTQQHPAPFDFLNKLTGFTLTIWGCNATGATTFDLIDGVTALSAADAAVLIDYYVALTVVELTLPPAKEAELRQALACLAESAITNPSTTEHELSTCVPDGGSDAGVDASSDGSATTDAATADASDGGSD